MQKNLYYIAETSNKYKIKVFLTGLIVFIILVGVVVVFTDTFGSLGSNIPFIESIKSVVIEEVKALTPTGLFYTGFAGGLFFIPLPQEIFFYYGLLKGNSMFLSLLTVNAGYLLSQVVNYYLGSRLNKFFLHIVSKRKLYKVRRFINKQGGKGVFIFNFLPLPAPVLTFGLGIAKYNIYRLFFYTILGTALKYALIILFFFIVN
ncbi:VTT domain-containing protein [Candidatus Pacearchaeota archaeon]|nr:VTT domain-containing protein [Candidatus Pacearchaeota archaeon]